MMTKKSYRIHIEWHSAGDQGFWKWEAREFGREEVLASNTSWFRWFGLWRAKRWCKRHAKGKIRIPDDGSRTVYYVA